MTTRKKAKVSGSMMLAGNEYELTPSSTHNSSPYSQLRGVIYARYSNGGGQTDQSLEGQVRDCRRYAKEHNIEIVEEYLDRHISGRDAEKRSAFQKMISDSSKQRFDVVLVWKTDRFARNRYDSAWYKRILRQNGVSIRYVAENIPDTDEGIILEAMLEGYAEYFSADLRKKVLRGMKESAYKCKALTCPPIGYVLDADKHYVIDEGVAPYIRETFRRYIRGDKLVDIARYLNQCGIVSQRKNPLSPPSITHIIRNEKYIGVYEYKNGGIRIEDAIPAIVDKSTFLAAQQRLLSQRCGTYARQNYGGHAKRKYLLSGIVYCGECGSHMFGETTVKFKGTDRESTHGYYVCRKHRQQKDCSNRAIRKDVLESTVINIVKRVILNPSILQPICEALSQVEFERSSASQLKALKQSKRQKQIALENVLKAIESGLYSQAIFDRLKTIEAQITSIDTEIQQISPVKGKLDKDLTNLLTNYFVEGESPEILENYWSDIIHCFIKSVTYFHNGTIIVRFNFHTSPLSDGPVPVTALEVSEDLSSQIYNFQNFFDVRDAKSHSHHKETEPF